MRSNWAAASADPRKVRRHPLARNSYRRNRVPLQRTHDEGFSRRRARLVLSIVGALLAVPTYFKPAIDKGEVVAVVDDAKTEKAVSNSWT